MAGGRGERFWPQSRLSRPKHLLPIVGDSPLLAQAVARLATVVPAANVWIITNTEQREAVLEVCPEVPAEQVIAEPVGRDTAAAVALAACLIQRRDPNASFCMLPADHVVADTEGFAKVVALAFEAAEQQDGLVTVGIHPAYPATGYGYIRKGDVACTISDTPVFAVRQFKEKPDADTARSYIDSGEYYWNAGMFFWRTSVIVQALQSLTPGLWAQLEPLRSGLAHGTALNDLLKNIYPSLEKISVDFAVMEKAPAVYVVESQFDWDDVGEWPAVARHFPADAAANVVRGDGLMVHSSGNIVVTRDGHTTVLVGVEDLIVVQTADATLICPKNRAQDIKAAVKLLSESPSHQHLI